MATFINGKTGLVELIDFDRNALRNRLNAEVRRIETGGKPQLTGKQREYILGQMAALTALSGYLSLDDVHVIPEAEFANNALLGGSLPLPGRSVSKVCSGCSTPLPEGPNLCAACRRR